jgi:xanthine dehydrogenase iron-sulfur cluster and FAD-binding subunit A
MRFDYLQPNTIGEVLSLLRKYKRNAKVIAGGTDVMLQARNKIVKPDCLVGITNIPGLEYIKQKFKLSLRMNPGNVLVRQHTPDPRQGLRLGRLYRDNLGMGVGAP